MRIWTVRVCDISAIYLAQKWGGQAYTLLLYTYAGELIRTFDLCGTNVDWLYF